MTRRSWIITVAGALAAFFAVASLVQIFFAGLGIFGAESFDLHESFGYVLHGIAIVVFLVALASPRRRRLAPAGLALAVLVTVQVGLVDTRDDAPGLAALHPLLGVLDIALA